MRKQHDLDPDSRTQFVWLGQYRSSPVQSHPIGIEIELSAEPPSSIP